MNARWSSVNELDRLAASVLCVGFDGTSAHDAPLERIARLGPGGIVLFARNVETVVQTRALTDAVRDAIGANGGAAPFFTVDQEGGRVSRLRSGAHEIPPMMGLGATRDADLAERIGSLIGADVRAAGMDVDFAPVLDLALRPQNTAIGDRALAGDPALVASLGVALLRGLHAQGIAATLKHFPGHGATADDSHLMLPRVSAPRETLRARDLLPFVAGIAAGARAVMCAHVVYDAYDPTRPATLSPAILTGLLRDELGFTGACFTDCLEMDAIAAGVGSAQGAALAIAAGADCAIVSHQLDLAEQARDAVVAAVRSGALPERRLRQAAARLAALHSVGAGEHVAPDVHAGAELAQRALTCVRAERARGVVVGEPVTVVSFEGATRDGARGAQADHASLSLALRQRHVLSELLRVALDPDAEMVEHLVSLVAAQSGRDVVILARRAHVYAGQARAIGALLTTAPDAVLVSLREPYDVALFPQARSVLCTYGDGEVNIEALAGVLTGRATPEGSLPVSLATPSRS